MDYLRTGPRTTTTDPSTDHSQNKIKKKNRNKDFTYCLSRLLVHGNRSLVSKFRALRWENVTDLSSVSGASYIIDIRHCHFFFSVAISIYERPGNLREASKFVLLSFATLFGLFLPLVLELVPGFTISNVNKMATEKKSQIS